MTRLRLAVFVLSGGLIATLMVLAAQLPAELRSLSTAKSDNAQWTVLQLETEAANLGADLARALSRQAPDMDAVSLRAEILISRLSLMRSARGRLLFSDSQEADALLRGLTAFADQIAAVLDRPGALTRADLEALDALNAAQRADIRRLAVLALAEGALRSDAQRERLARKLTLIGIAALALIVVLSGAVLIVDRLLRNLRRHERAAKATAGHLSAMVTASLDGIIIADAAGKVIAFNAAAERVFGWRAAEIIGRSMRDTIVPHAHRAAHEAGMRRFLDTGEPHVIDAGRIELTALRKSGEDFPIELNITSVDQGDGTIFVAYVRDISARKIAEQELIDSRDRAQRMDRAKSQLLTVMSHEMRTPLNGILGVLDLMRTTALSKQQEHYVDVAAASGEVLLEQVNEALDATRLETDELVLATRGFHMAELIDGLVDGLRPLAEEKGLRLRTDVAANMARGFVSDPGRIRQILTNLLGNAIKYSKTGDIVLAVSGIHGDAETAATFRVTDSGPGIAPDQLDAIFEDFVALRRASGRLERSDGLGLSISHKIARRMGGALTAESTLGRGSSFTLSLPIARRDGAAPRPSGATQPAQSVLVVEDNPINRAVLREMLLKLGHQVTEAEDGAQGVAAAAERDFDLIVMDISMPEMDGIAATRAIRAGAGPNAATHILGLTAHGREEFRDRALAAGMNGFVGKPIRLPVLSRVLAGLQGAPLPGAAPPRLDAPLLQELVATLGQDAARAAADTLFADLAAETQRLRSQPPDHAAAARALHKLKGAADLFGLISLSEAILAADAANARQDPIALSGAADRLEGAAADTRAALQALLAEQLG